MDFITLVTTTISLADKALSLVPNYDQRKKKKFYELKERYENEFRKDYPERDDNLIDHYRNDLLCHIQAFSSEISR